MSSIEKVDFNSIDKHIDEEKLDIGIIRIVYENLTDSEFIELMIKQNAIRQSENQVLAEYPQDRKPLFPEKAIKVLYLGA